MNRKFENFVSFTLLGICIALGVTSTQIAKSHDHLKQIEKDLNSLNDDIDSIGLRVPAVDTMPVLAEPDSLNIDELMSAIIHVESRGNADAYNESSGAVGCMQLMPIMVKEVNRICKLRGIQKSYTMDDRWSCEKSKQMFRIWYNFHHRRSSAERIARHWWGGPKWGEHAISMSYWNKVKDRLDT